MALSECQAKIDASGLELVEHGNYSFPIACYFDELDKTKVNWHWHEELELLIITQGTAIIAVDGKQFIVNEGDGFFINSGILHAGWGYDKSVCKIHSLVFHPRLVGGYSESVFYTGYINPLLNSTEKYVFLNKSTLWHSQILTEIDSAWKLCVNEPNGYEFNVRNSLSAIISLLHSNLDCKAADISDRQDRNSQRIKLMLEYINSNYSDNITMSDIANIASISKSECLRCFNETIGTSPIRYLKTLRLKKAAELLVSSKEKIVDIGISCGFQDMSYFAKSFREIYGCSPSEYKR